MINESSNKLYLINQNIIENDISYIKDYQTDYSNNNLININNYNERINNSNVKMKLMKNTKNKNIYYNPIQNKSIENNLFQNNEQNKDNSIIKQKKKYNYSLKNFSTSNLNITNFNKKNKNKRNNSNTSIYTSNYSYWEKRNQETKNKLNDIKNEEIKKKKSECRTRPIICKKSNEIAKKLLNNENVFDRLTNGNSQRKHNEKVKKIAEQINQNKNPNINLSSKKIQRSINDLYKWKNNIEIKKNEIFNLIYKKNNNPKINKSSEEMLIENNPDYLNKKVEERLFEQGKIIQLKKKEKEEQYLKEVCKTDNKIKNNYSYIESKYLNIKPSINKKVKKRINITLNKDKNSIINYNGRINSVGHHRDNNLNSEKLNNINYSLNINDDIKFFPKYSSQRELINENLNNNSILEKSKTNKEIKDIRKKLNQFYNMENKNKNNSSNNNINNDENFLNNKNVYNNIIYNRNKISKYKNILDNDNYNSNQNLHLNLSSVQTNIYDCSENNNQNNFNENNTYPIYYPYKDDYNNNNINNNVQYCYQINEQNIINEIFQRENEHLNYLDERLRKNQEFKNKILQNL